MWQCSTCTAEVDEPLDVCWNCGTTSDGTTDPQFAADAELARAIEPAREAVEPTQFSLYFLFGLTTFAAVLFWLLSAQLLWPLFLAVLGLLGLAALCGALAFAVWFLVGCIAIWFDKAKRPAGDPLPWEIWKDLQLRHGATTSEVPPS
jgi:apolipoprotein N-acyltransferase